MSDIEQSIIELLERLRNPTVEQPKPPLKQESKSTEEREVGDYVKNLFEEAAERKKRCPLPPVDLSDSSDEAVPPLNARQTGETRITNQSPLPAVELGGDTSNTRQTTDSSKHNTRELQKKAERTAQADEAVDALKGLFNSHHTGEVQTGVLPPLDVETLHQRKKQL